MGVIYPNEGILGNIYNRTQGVKRLEMISEFALGCFLDEMNNTFSLDFNKSFTDNLINLKNNYVYNSSYIEYFFKLLEKHNYYMKQEIKDAIEHLCLLGNPSENKEVIEQFLKSPVIQDISFDGKDKFTVYSEKYGTFVATIAYNYFNSNPKIKRYIETQKLTCSCHAHTGYLSTLFPDYYSITSLCKNYFDEFWYYHSYTYDSSNDVVIDLCSNAVIDQAQYSSLFSVDELSRIKNSEVKKEFDIVAKKLDTSYDMYIILIVALYKQYLRSINYDGSLDDAPSLKKTLSLEELYEFF